MEVEKKKLRFLGEVRQIMRVQHYAFRTEQSYVDWIRRFILFHEKRHPIEMGASEVAEFLTYLSVKRNVAPATQGQALNALVFLYRKVLNRPMGVIPGIVRARKREKIPEVLTQLEVANMLSKLDRGALVSRLFALRFRPSPNGVHPATRERYRFRPPVDHRQKW